MSGEVLAPTERLSRPAYQRFELGPLLAAITPEVLKIADKYTDEFLPKDIGKRHPNGPVLMNLREGFKDVAMQAANEWTSAPGDNLLRNRLSSMIGSVYMGSTFHTNSYGLVAEGMKSGLLMPIRLYGLLVEREVLGVLPYDAFDKEAFANTLRSDWFGAILHSLSDLPNGKLGPWSTEPSSTHAISDVIRQLAFENDGDGAVRLDKASSKRLVEDLTGHNSYSKQFFLSKDNYTGISGGCPVRHRVYKKIGPLATDALQEAGFDAATLNDPTRKTTIELCAEYVANKVAEIPVHE